MTTAASKSKKNPNPAATTTTSNHAHSQNGHNFVNNGPNRPALFAIGSESGQDPRNRERN
jgi:hypothetical protein